jgi:EF hand
MVQVTKSLRLGSLAFAAALVLSIPAAEAQELGGVGELDTNGDHTITIAEAKQALQAQFARMDTDHDGKLSEDEYVNARMAVLSKLDTNGDGKIDRSEIRARIRSRLGR